MKIRCNSCYKVLHKNEVHCTHCGAYSEEMNNIMAQGTKELDALSKFKITLIIYIAIAFIGSGIVNVAFAATQNKLQNAFSSDSCKAIAFLITSVILTSVLIIVNIKEIKKMLFNTSLKQILYAFLIGLIIVIIIGLLSSLSFATRIIPENILDHIKGLKFLEFNLAPFTKAGMIISLILACLSEELILRKRLIDALDEETLFGDKAVILISGLASTILNFIWMMSLETVIMMFLLNLTMSAIYIYTNRSTGINIILRIILICFVIII